ncbi:hypothetical protein EK21DRAFT_103461 [Setomelanomma holmii]|uniref:Uncharacterized protein n=1 Tax=Setomelanomma holmii TaxID=210430 RepID=A0A9P4H2V5_9PLEO|nr:hypothetical protein EK21DRAFT_103461 [Setomelanomma holmii]
MTSHLRRQNSECPSGGNFYVCSKEMGGFSGCCTSDPCFSGGGCPKEKDRTPGRESSTIATTSAVATPSFQSSDGTARILPVSTIASSPSALATVSSTSSNAPQLTAYVTVHPSLSPSPTGVPPASDPGIPSAAIAGAAVGAVILIALGIIVFVCCKRRRKRSIHQAPIYVSPYNSSDSDMSEHPKLVKAYMRNPWNEIQQLDSSEVGPRRHGRIGSRCFAELPAEPVTRRA